MDNKKEDLSKDESKDDVIESIFDTDTSTKKSDLDVLSELFSGKGIETRTELTDKQIVLINQKRGICAMLDFTDLHLILEDFMKLQVSKNRKGRAEFVEGFKAQRENDIQKSQGFLGGLKDKLGFQ